MIAIILQFQVKPEQRETFIQALVEHGSAAVSVEPGTRRFDVIVDQHDLNHIFMYEAYADSDALNAHLSGESHQRFVRTMQGRDLLTVPLAGPPRPFAPFVVGLGNSVFTAEDAHEATPDHPADRYARRERRVARR